jgi:hypothetical protein
MPRARAFPVTALIFALSGCSDPAAPGMGGPSGAQGPPMRMEATIDGRVLEATVEGGFASSGLEVNKGGIQLSAEFTGSSGDAHAPVTGSPKFRLDVMGSPAGGPLPARVEFTRYNAFSGALYWIAPGQSVELWLGLYHVTEDHYDFGPFPVTVERRSHDAESGL